LIDVVTSCMGISVYVIQVHAVLYLAYNEPCVLWKDEMMEHLLQSLEGDAHA